MAKKKVSGRCALCQKVGPLTFEHFPPRSVGNKVPVVTREWTDFINNPSEFNKGLRGPVQQRGSGTHALCGGCNSWQGRELVPEYQRWALPLAVAMQSEAGTIVAAMADSIEPPSILHMALVGEFRPGRFARYALAATMLGTGRGKEPPKWQTNATKMVQEFSSQEVPEGFPRLLLSVCAGPLTGVAGTRIALAPESGISTVWHASAFGRPFGFWLVDGPVGTGYVDITDWLTVSADHMATRMEFDSLTFGFSHTIFPGDLRSLAAIRSRAEEEVELHPAYLGPHPDGHGHGTGVVVTDPQRGTTTEIRIEVPGLWRGTETDEHLVRQPPADE